jgi:hypothetical protein
VLLRAGRFLVLKKLCLVHHNAADSATSARIVFILTQYLKDIPKIFVIVLTDLLRPVSTLTTIFSFVFVGANRMKRLKITWWLNTNSSSQFYTFFGSFLCRDTFSFDLYD